jgi:hypothetical protein
MTVSFPGGDKSYGLAAQRVDDEKLSSVRAPNGCKALFTAAVVVSNIDVTEIEEGIARLNERDAVFGFILSSFCFVPFEGQGHERPCMAMKLRVAPLGE